MRQQIKVLIIKAWLFVVGYLPANPKLILFESFLGKQYSCNPKAIYEYLHKNYPQYKLYWSVDQKYLENFSEKNLKLVRRYSIKWLLILGFSKYWITNSRMPKNIIKPKHTTYLQTWHGTPLKKLVFDMEDVHMPNTTADNYKANFYKESRNWDYLLSPNRYSTEIFERAFRFDKAILEYGYPRNDILYHGNNQAKINSLKNKLKIPLAKKVILYAPTWRDNQFYKVGHYKFDLPLDLLQLKQKYEEDCVILLRMHYLVAENFDLEPYRGFVYDFSQKVDISELYLVADLLITDYSSVFFDYANLRRPMIFYMYDIKEYRDILRGFYFDIEKEAPGPIVKNMQELCEAFEEFKRQGKYLCSEANYQKFYEKYCYMENGNSAEALVESVII